MVANRGVAGEHVVVGLPPKSEFPLFQTLPNTAAASRAALPGNVCRWSRALWEAFRERRASELQRWPCARLGLNPGLGGQPGAIAG